MASIRQWESDRNADQRDHSGPCEIKTNSSELANLYGTTGSKKKKKMMWRASV